MSDFGGEFLFEYGSVQGFVDSIPEEVFFDVSAPRTSPLFSITPTTGSSITRTATIHVDVTDDQNALADVTIWAVLADGSTEIIWNGSSFESLFSGGSTSDITGGKRYSFAYGGFGWPTTTVTIYVKAVDPVGAAGGPSSASYTISNPPTAPTIGPFSPASSGSQTRAASVQIDITDAEGASAITLVLITAITDDGTKRRVVSGSTFSAPFTAGSSRSSIANGYRYVVAWDTPGWPTTGASLLVEAMNSHGLVSSTTWTATITDPPAAPVISFSPSSGGSMARADSVQIDATDDEGAASLSLLRVYAILADGSERLAAASATIKAPFTDGSSRSSISGGYRYIIAWDSPGWPSTTAGLRADAVDEQGRVTTSASWSATITDPPAAPVISFSPSTGNTTTRAGSVLIDITDDLGAASLSFVRIDAQLEDGSVRGVYGSSFAADFTDASTRTSITGGYRYTVIFNGDGWPSSTLLFSVVAEDSEGQRTTATCSLTITDPPAAPDTTQPTVTIISPTPPGPIGRNDPVKLQVTDVGGLRRVKLYVTMGDEQRVIHNGYTFRPRYVVGSTMTTISNGFEYVLLRSGGWTEAPSFEVYAIDNAGNER